MYLFIYLFISGFMEDSNFSRLVCPSCCADHRVLKVRYPEDYRFPIKIKLCHLFSDGVSIFDATLCFSRSRASMRLQRPVLQLLNSSSC